MLCMQAMIRSMERKLLLTIRLLNQIINNKTKFDFYESLNIVGFQGMSPYSIWIKKRI